MSDLQELEPIGAIPQLISLRRSFWGSRRHGKRGRAEDNSGTITPSKVAEPRSASTFSLLGKDQSSRPGEHNDGNEALQFHP
jgi:hypothetical protein